MNYVQLLFFIIPWRCYLLVPSEESILYTHCCQHSRRVDMKILLALTRLLKMYIVIFVHLVFVYKLIHVNLKPCLCLQVSVLCRLAQLRILVMIAVFYTVSKGKMRLRRNLSTTKDGFRVRPVASAVINPHIYCNSF